MISRRRLLSLTALGMVPAAAYPALIEPRWLEVTHTDVRLGIAPKKPIRLLHLADFHASIFVPNSVIEHAIDLGIQQQPDLICLTGDFITHRGGFDAAEYVQLLKRLPRAAPAYAILGNHDGGAWAPRQGGFADHLVVERILEESGVKLLHNRAESVRVNGCDLSLVGVGDLWSGEIDAAAAFASALANVPTILMSHNPDSKQELNEYPWHLMLSGHTHGGQVIVPFEGPIYAPVQDKAFVAGLKPWQGRQIFVTRGVGTVGGVRFRCRPEVSVLRLV